MEVDPYVALVCLPFLAVVAILIVVGIVKFIRNMIIVGIFMLIVLAGLLWHFGLITF